MFKSIDSNREHLRKYLPWVDSTETIDDTISFIKDSKKNDMQLMVALTLVYGTKKRICRCYRFSWYKS